MNSAGSRGESGSGSHRRPKEGLVPNPMAPLREQIHEVMRFFHYSRRTEQTYWASAFAEASAGHVRFSRGFGGTSPLFERLRRDKSSVGSYGVGSGSERSMRTMSAGASQHWDRAGPARASGCGHDPDLHPCDAEAGNGGEAPGARRNNQ